MRRRSLKFPEFGKLQKNVVAVHHRNDEADHAVPHAAAEEVVAQKRKRRMEGELKHIGASAALVHLLRSVGGVAIDRLEMVGDIAKSKVLKLPSKLSDGATYDHPLVDVVAGPFGGSSIVK